MIKKRTVTPRVQQWLPAVLLSFTIILTGCGGSSSSSSPDSSSPPPANEDTPNLLNALAESLASPIGSKSSACGALQFSSITAAPGDVITLTGLPVDFEQPAIRAIATIANQDIATPIPVFPTDIEGQYEFATPPYYLDIEQGGKVSLELSDIEANKHCAGIDFTIEPLPELVTAENSNDYLDNIQIALETWADEVLKRLGEDPADLLSADVDTLEPNVQMLWLAKQYVSSDEEGYLKSLQSSDPHLLANILALSKLKSRLEEATSKLQAAPTYRPSAPIANSNALPSNSPPPTPPFPPASIQARAFSIPHIDCDVATLQYKHEINTVADLSKHMKAAGEGIILEATGIFGDLLSVISLGAAINGTNLDAILGKVLDSADRTMLETANKKVGKFGKRISVASDITFVIEKLREAQLAMEPSEITEFSVIGAEKTWIEDREDYELMSWQQARISAKGKEYNLYKVLLESGVQGGSWLAGYLGGNAGSAAYGMATLVFSDKIKTKIESLSKNQCLRLEAPEYGPFIFADPTAKWTKTTVRDGETNVEVVADKNYRGIHIGTAALEVKPRNNEFPSETVKPSTFINVVVKEVEIGADPGYRSVNSTPKTFNDLTAFAIAYDLHAGEKISATADKGSIDAQAPESDTLKVTYTTPSNLDELPAHITYRWEGKTLPGGDDGLRQAKTTFDKKGKIVLSPKTACLTPNEELSIEATIEGFPSADAIAWAWTGGHLRDAPGGDSLHKIFTAPSSLDEYTITAFSIDDPGDVFDETKVTVSKSCIAKAWHPVVTHTIDGNGIYSDGGSCPSTNNPETVKHIVGAGGDVQPPSPFDAELPPWINKSEHYTWPSIHQSTRYVDEEDTCYSDHFEGRNNSEVIYSAKDDGTLRLQLNVDMAGESKLLGSHRETVAPTISAIAGGFYYIPIESNTELSIGGSIECNNVIDNGISTGAVGLGTAVMLYPLDENGNLLAGWKPTNTGNMPYVIENIRCQGNEMNFFDKTIGINKFNNKRPSKVVLQVVGTLSALPPMSALMNVGSYESQGSIDLEIKVEVR